MRSKRSHTGPVQPPSTTTPESSSYRRTRPTAAVGGGPADDDSSDNEKKTPRSDPSTKGDPDPSSTASEGKDGKEAKQKGTPSGEAPHSKSSKKKKSKKKSKEKKKSKKSDKRRPAPACKWMGSKKGQIVLEGIRSYEGTILDFRIKNGAEQVYVDWENSAWSATWSNLGTQNNVFP